VETVAELTELEGLEQQEATLGWKASEPDIEVEEQFVDDGADMADHTPQRIESTSRVGSRGPVLLSNCNTP
jgi:hypothetical protein